VCPTLLIHKISKENSVNSIFNPSYIDELHPKPTHYRQNLLTEARSTNYGVVRLELIEQLYETMYDQKRELGPDETQWPHRIMGGRFVKSMQPNDPSPSDGLALVVSHVNGPPADEVLNVDVVIAATGYQRNAHVEMLRDASGLLPTVADGGMSGLDGWQVVSEEGSTKSLEVGRDYRVKFEDGAVQEGSGVWLQGCCEGTHGVSFYQRHSLDQPIISTNSVPD
jgi:L-ornithine N5-oxygenase